VTLRNDGQLQRFGPISEPMGTLAAKSYEWVAIAARCAARPLAWLIAEHLGGTNPQVENHSA
jgi:hypothetical protein